MMDEMNELKKCNIFIAMEQGENGTLDGRIISVGGYEGVKRRVNEHKTDKKIFIALIVEQTI